MKMTRQQVDEHQRRHGFIAPAETKKADAFDDAVEAGTEAALQREVAAWLVLNGACGVVHHRMDRKSSCGVGVADLCFGWPRNGKLLYCAIELKTGKRKPTNAQVDFLASVKRAGGIAEVCRSLPDVIRAINAT